MNRKDFIKEIKPKLLIKEELKQFLLEKKAKEKEEELLIRREIRRLIKEAKKEIENAPHASTGINILQDLLKKIIPSLEQDYKTLTTDLEQRKSFRSHIINGVEKALQQSELNKDAGEQPDVPMATPSNPSLTEDDPLKVSIDASALPPQDKFIDISGKQKNDPEQEKIDSFSLPGADETGRNMALTAFDKIENQILDAYSVLSAEKDKKLFFDYLITNLKLYFDKFENEIKESLPEPTTQEYEDDVSSVESPGSL